MSTSSTTTAPAPKPAVVVRVAKDGTPFFEAKWRSEGRQVKRRLGPAWIERDGDRGWRKRRGRTPDGWLDDRAAYVAALEQVAEVEVQAAARRAREAIDATLTVRRLAGEWLGHLKTVEGAKPSTLANHRSMLAEPGTKHRRGQGACEGRLMRAFGDRPVQDVTPREVARWLATLDAAGLSGRNVNRHRQTLHAIFAYAMRADTYELEKNPVAATSRRREPPPARLDFYEYEEVEALARACESGLHRGTRTFRGVPVEHQEAELEARRAEDHRDADFFRLLFFSGLRLSEGLALRWDDIQFLADMSGAILTVSRNVSAGEETSTKSRRTRQVPVPRPATRALARLGAREDFMGPDDYVFANRLGRRLDGSAMRSRYKRARDAAGLRDVKLHGLRHAAGSVMARSMPLVSVRDILGHAKIDTTNRYLHSKIDAAAVAAVNAAFGELPAPDHVSPPAGDD